MYLPRIHRKKSVGKRWANFTSGEKVRRIALAWFHFSGATRSVFPLDLVFFISSNVVVFLYGYLGFLQRVS